jgi:diguanylate cyclase (GGDEF)-like protein
MTLDGPAEPVEVSAVTQAVVDALDAEVAVVDPAGRIVATNIAWESRLVRGAASSGAWVACGVGDDYLGVLGTPGAAVAAHDARSGIAAVLGGSLPEFGVEYEAEVEGEERQYRLTATTLPGGVPGALVSHEDISWRRTLEDRLAEHATHDALTGLPNRLLLEDRLRGALVRAQRTGHLVAVMFVDIDRFTSVNDTLGHAAGDQVLVTVARRLVRACRASDTVTRFGGDEFVLVVDDVDGIENVDRVAARVVESMTAPIVVDGAELWISASVGVAVAGGLGSVARSTTDGLVRDADTAAYRAKEAGRNRYVVFEPAMRERVVERLALTTALRHAVAEEQLRVAYQPLFSCGDDSVVGVEALVRWHHPERGLIPPSEFLEAAEESGLMVDVGAWVLDQVCRQTAEWQRIAPRGFRVNVNLSPRQLADPAAPGLVRQTLARHGVDPHRIGVEITEKALTEDPETAQRTLHELLGYGVAVSVDDFGSGFSSLAYLQRFPVGALKIDRFFVSRLPDDRAASAMVRGIVGLADALGIETVAEGVETQAQRDAVAQLGCRSYQGFVKARPGAPEVVTTLLETSTGVSLLPVRRP